MSTVKSLNSYSCTSRSIFGENVDVEAELKAFQFRRGTDAQGCHSRRKSNGSKCVAFL